MRRLILALAGMLLLSNSAVAQDGVPDLRATAVGRPLAAALDTCGIQVIRHSMPKGIGGLWLDTKHLIILAQDLEGSEATLVLAHESTHAARTCAGLTPPQPADVEARPAWIDAMLDEEAEALVTEASMAAELISGGVEDAREAAARRPFVDPLLAMLVDGVPRAQVRAAARHAIEQTTYRKYYESLFSLSAAR
ncbi:hypothetical protein [Azospirillum sp.]|uniref:hypothetical protein n=1 Tax=Azospirillum sp. TaxID=34012 RepID=UPI003D739727